ncbi:molybdate transport system regulatory protein [Pararhodobacter aggregans]|nr:molybdate transport system regulatory protein [Pararhodobacter aggregans]
MRDFRAIAERAIKKAAPGKECPGSPAIRPRAGLPWPGACQEPARLACRGMPADPLPTRLRLRLLFGTDAMLGPGKADLLQQIRETGSISAAGRAMGMSYKRAWSLVEEMNAAFREPLVQSARGGASGGGAQLTAMGEAVLVGYRRIEEIAAEAAGAEIAALAGFLRDMPGGK